MPRKNSANTTQAKNKVVELPDTLTEAAIATPAQPSPEKANDSGVIAAIPGEAFVAVGAAIGAIWHCLS